MPKTTFTATPYPVGELFSFKDPIYVVPKRQRHYAWSSQYWETLWDDLKTAKDSAEPEYFLGTIVVVADGPPFTIIDGQQRLATIAAMFGAIRDHLHKLGDANTAREIQKALIIRSDYRGHQTPILTLGIADREEFRRYIQLQPDDPDRYALYSKAKAQGPGRPRANLIRGVFDYYFGKIEEAIQHLPSDAAKRERLIDWQEFLEKNVLLVRIDVDSDVTAYTIFETLNDRGLALSVDDLLKNHLLSRARDDDEANDVFAKWEGLIVTLEGENVARFLRHQWMSRNGVVTERQLYKAWKESIQTSKRTPMEVLSELSEDGETYTRLLRPVLGDACGWELLSLSEMGLRQGLSFLLAAKTVAKSDKEFEKAVRLVEAITVRYTIVANNNPNQLERKYAEWAGLIRKNGLTQFEDIRKDAEKLCPSNKDFQNGFADLRELASAQARYLLRKLAQYQGTKEVEIAMNKVELEHILPQSPAQAWLAELQLPAEEVTELIDRLGNLTLLAEKLNRQARNRPFLEKRDKFYAKSKISITNSLINSHKWGHAEITARQKQWAIEAPSAWNL